MKRFILTTLVAGLLVSGCDSKSTQPPVNQAISIALAAAAGEITQGGMLDVTVNLTRTGGYNGAVTLTVEGLPAGVTAGAATIAAGSNSGTITLTATGAAAPTTANATVRATGSGVTAATTTLALTVQVLGTYTLSAPAGVSIVQGASDNVTVAINRTGGFTGNVAFSATTPSGITAAFTPQSAAGTVASSTLALTVAAGVAPGTYPVTVTGTSAGLPNQTAAINVMVTAAGSFTLGVTPATLSIAAGAAGTANVAITRLNGFAGAVSLSATAPAGITATLDPASTTGVTSALNVAVAAGVAAGNYTVTVNGTAAGIAQQSASLTVTVTAAGGFSIALSPTALAVQQGAAGTTQVTVTRTGGFAADVALTATTPAGVTASFAPATLSGGVLQSTLTVTAAGDAPLGAAQVTVRANAAGQAEQTAALALTVNASTGGGGNVTWIFCGFSGLPQFVAAQDGDGPWTRVTGNAGNEYSFQISSGRGGIAWVRPSPEGGWDTQAFFGTTAELQAHGTALCWGTTGPGKTVTGSTSAPLSAMELAFITLGRTQASVTGGGSAFTLTGVLDGPLDLVAARSALNLSTFAFAPDRIVIQRNLNPANNAVLAPIDFGTGTAPASAQLTMTNLMGDWTASIGMFQTERNTQAVLYTDFGTTSAPTRPWYGVAAGQRVAGDLHIVNAVAVEPVVGGSPLSQTRQVMFVTANVADRTVELGPRMAHPTVTVLATQPYARLRIDHTPAEPYHRHFTGSFIQGDAATERIATMQKTSSYVTAGGAARIDVPDLAGVTGWNNDWGLKTGAETTWVLTGTGWNGTGIVSPVLVEGATLMSGTRMGQITP